jgi:hypothetical protein
MAATVPTNQQAAPFPVREFGSRAKFGETQAPGGIEEIDDPDEKAFSDVFARRKKR